jgi:hypothetical protein
MRALATSSVPEGHQGLLTRLNDDGRTVAAVDVRDAIPFPRTPGSARY